MNQEEVLEEKKYLEESITGKKIGPTSHLRELAKTEVD